MAEQNSDTYRWRGDLGLLDRLAYKPQEPIPQNWAMTSMDAARIEQYNQQGPLRIQSRPTDLEHPYRLMDQEELEETSTTPLESTRIPQSAPSSGPDRHPDQPKVKR